MTGLVRQPGETFKEHWLRTRSEPYPDHDVTAPWAVLRLALDALEDASKALRALDEHAAAMRCLMVGSGWLPEQNCSPLTLRVEQAHDALGPVLAADYRARHPEED